MESWQAATTSDRYTYSVIAIIFRNHPYLLRFLFEDRSPRIRFQPMELRRRAANFSSGEQLLIRVALDVWSGSGNAKIWQILETLDADNFLNVLVALAKLRSRPSAN